VVEFHPQAVEDRSVMLDRHIRERILEGLADSPVVFVQGARQTGKSTLVRALAEGAHKACYLTLDDHALLAAARSDPHGFIAGLDGDIVIEEVQGCPELFAEIKLAVVEHVRRSRARAKCSSIPAIGPYLAKFRC
jgi:hypothetical protein